MRSCGIRRTARRACTIGAYETSCATKRGKRFRDFHIPTTVDDYRAIYRAYLHDPDLQDARARWPFVNMWDNHEFQLLGWQSLQKFEGVSGLRKRARLRRTRLFFEYQPAVWQGQAADALDSFHPSAGCRAPVSAFDSMAWVRTAITCLRSIVSGVIGRFAGAGNVELIVTDQRSYRSEDRWDVPEADAFTSADFPEFVPEEASRFSTRGRAFNGGQPPAVIRYGTTEVANFQREAPPQAIWVSKQQCFWNG